MASSSSSPSLHVTQPQVFINFRGEDVRNDFVDSLVHEMQKENLNVFIDKHGVKGVNLNDLLLTEIEKSTVAIAIFSKNYTNAYWCLKELARINDCVDRGTLMAIPVFYRIKPSVVKKLSGDFGFAFRSLKLKHRQDPGTEKWEEAIASITENNGMELIEHGQITDSKFIKDMIVEVKRSLEYFKKKADQGRDPKTIQNIKPETVQIQQLEAVQNKQPEAVQIRQPEAVQNKQLEAVQIKKPVITPHGCTFTVDNLTISGLHNARYWTFLSISESPSEEAIKVPKMRECYYLEVKGMFETTNLTYGTRYEVVFVVKIEDTMSIWDTPARVQLMVPEKDLQERELQLVDLERNEWVEIHAGVFDARPHKAKVEFYLYQYDSKKKKTGLVVKGAILRPLG